MQGWGPLRELVAVGGGAGVAGLADPCMQGPEGAWTVWTEWRACRRQLLVVTEEQEKQQQEEEKDLDWLAEAPRHWADCKAAAVLVELRRAEPRSLLKFGVKNALENLPVAWCVQVVVGSGAVAETVATLFEAEVSVGKVLLTRVAAGKEEEEEQAAGEAEKEEAEGKVGFGFRGMGVVDCGGPMTDSIFLKNRRRA